MPPRPVTIDNPPRKRTSPKLQVAGVERGRGRCQAQMTAGTGKGRGATRTEGWSVSSIVLLARQFFQRGPLFVSREAEEEEEEEFELKKDGTETDRVQASE